MKRVRRTILPDDKQPIGRHGAFWSCVYQDEHGTHYGQAYGGPFFGNNRPPSIGRVAYLVRVRLKPAAAIRANNAGVWSGPPQSTDPYSPRLSYTGLSYVPDSYTMDELEPKSPPLRDSMGQLL